MAEKAFTWRDYSETGFEELAALLGPEFRVVDGKTPCSVEIWRGDEQFGELFALDPTEIMDCLGPCESSHIDPETYDESCLSLSLVGELFPVDATPRNLEVVADALRRRVT